MNKLANLNIGPRLGLAFAVLTLLAAALTVLAIARMQTISESLTVIDRERLPKVQKLEVINGRVNLVANELRNALLATNPEERAAALERTINARSGVPELLKEFEQSITSDKG